MNKTSPTLKGRNIPFVNQVKYLGVIFDRKNVWTIHIGTIEIKAFPTFIRVFSLFKSERLSANVNLTLHKALVRCIMNYASPPGNLVQISIFWNCSSCKTKPSSVLAIFQGARIDPRFACGFQNSVRVCDFVTKLCRQEVEIIQNHENVNFRNTVQCETQSRKYNGIKQGGGEGYL